jgi:hypothetical protein
MSYTENLIFFLATDASAQVQVIISNAIRNMRDATLTTKYIGICEYV